MSELLFMPGGGVNPEITRSNNLSGDATGYNKTVSQAGVTPPKTVNYQAPPRTPTVDPRLQDLVDKANEIASDYEKNIPNLSAELMGVAGNQARQLLAQSLDQNKKNANARGFLYSGMKQGADIASGGEYASNIANAQYGINQELNNNLNTLKQTATQAGLTEADTQLGYNQAAQSLNTDLANMQTAAANNQAAQISQAAEGAGQAIGTGLGLLSKSQPETSSASPYTMTQTPQITYPFSGGNYNLPGVGANAYSNPIFREGYSPQGFLNG